MSDIGERPLGARDKTLAGVLLAIPLLALLIVPIYARSSPYLWGFPFFYWYQLLWVFIAAACTQAAFIVVRRARARRSELDAEAGPHRGGRP
jgi:hypothetical protein